MSHRDERDEIKELRKIEHDLRKENAILRDIRDELKPHPHLSSIEIAFTRRTHMATVGPVTLEQGQSAIASLVYKDQFGQPMPDTFVPPPASYTIDNPAIASSTPDADGQHDVVAWVSGGAANLSASVLGPAGANLTDTKTVTCVPPVVDAPVLSSIEIAFDAPAAPAAKKP